MGALRVTEGFRAFLGSVPEADRRRFAWRAAKTVAAEARRSGFAGVVLMGLKLETISGEAHELWHDDALPPWDPDEMRTART